MIGTPSSVFGSVLFFRWPEENGAATRASSQARRISGDRDGLSHRNKRGSEKQYDGRRAWAIEHGRPLAEFKIGLPDTHYISVKGHRPMRRREFKGCRTGNPTGKKGCVKLSRVALSLPRPCLVHALRGGLMVRLKLKHRLVLPLCISSHVQ